jgi:hypothetical protein
VCEGVRVFFADCWWLSSFFNWPAGLLVSEGGGLRVVRFSDKRWRLLAAYDFLL